MCTRRWAGWRRLWSGSAEGSSPMMIDAAKVRERMRDRGLGTSQVAARMRRGGLPGTTAHWVSMVERGIWGDCPESWVAGLAKALGVQPSEITARPRLYLVKDEASP